MAIKIGEWFGYSLDDKSSISMKSRKDETCPFINTKCTKTFSDSTKSGVCSVVSKGRSIAICPNRLYARELAVLQDVANTAFGTNAKIVHPNKFQQIHPPNFPVIAFGKRFGSELKVPTKSGKGSYFVDWILAKVNSKGELLEFVAVEIQTIDTTGTYKPEVVQLRKNNFNIPNSKAGLNWENVNKRILPQLIYKGNVLRREELCTKGLFFICPQQVFERILGRLGGNMHEYKNLQPGSITLKAWELGGLENQLALVPASEFRTTVDQIANAFVSPSNLPDAGVYESAIKQAIKRFS